MIINDLTLEEVHGIGKDTQPHIIKICDSRTKGDKKLFYAFLDKECNIFKFLLLFFHFVRKAKFNKSGILTFTKTWIIWLSQVYKNIKS